MNKILLEDNSSLKDLDLVEDAVIIISNISDPVNIHINKNINVFTLITDCSFDLNLFINKDSSFSIFSVNTSINVRIDLLKSGIKFNYSYSTINDIHNNYKVDINHFGKNITSKIVNHGISLNNSKLSFVINTIVPKNVTGVNTNQDSKIIIFGDNNATIKPNLLVDNDDIEANHAAYIGRLKKEDLFYLMSRGINLKDAEGLLVKSFLLGNMDISFEEREIVLNNIKKYWR